MKVSGILVGFGYGEDGGFVGTGEPGPLLVGLLAANPIDGVRALLLSVLGADVLLGPTGASVQRRY